MWIVYDEKREGRDGGLNRQRVERKQVEGRWKASRSRMWALSVP